MSAEWKHGKVLWFDDLSGEGMITDESGHAIYFHYSSLKKNKAKRKTIDEDADVKFTVYDNGLLRQVDELIEV